MKKDLLLAGLLTAFSLAVKSQVGINTSAPTATLDVTAKNSTGTGSSVEGILVPRVDRQKAQSMTGVPVSTMIYVNSIATGTNSGTALNIDAVGYYYYDGTVWVKLTNPVNIYNADGTLTGNRTVTQGANTLAFTGTQTNAFSVDGNTLSVDAANNRVGIGTTSPTTTADINGNLRIATTTGTNSSNNVSTLVKDNITGEVKTITSPSGNKIPIALITYNLSNVQGDYISDYDTKISTVDYTVVVVGASFNTSLATGTAGSQTTFFPYSAYATPNGTWRLLADYGSTSTPGGVSGGWQIFCLVINNSIGKYIGTVNQNLGGSSVGAAPGVPPGL